MAGYNTSSAYDLSLYDNPQKKEVPAPRVKLVKNRGHQVASSILSPRVLCAFAIVITLVVLMVYNHVQLTELSSEISRLNKQMQELESENVQMTSVLESAEQIQNIRALALAMGMQKRDEYQTERIYLYHEDKIERTESSPELTSAESAKLAVTSFFSRFKEYLSDS